MKKFNPTFLVALLVMATMTLTTMRPTLAVQVFTSFACSLSTPCVTAANSSTGPAIQGTSSLGRGIQGQTNFQSTSASNGKAGLYGIDGSLKGVFDSGVTGQSSRGFGVWGRSTTGFALYGLTTSGTGVQAQATNGTGVFAFGNIGIEAADFGAASHQDDVFANGSGARLFRGNNSVGKDVFTVTDTGMTTMYEATAGSFTVGTGLLGEGTQIGVEGYSSHIGVEGTNTASASSIAVFANGFGGHLYDTDNSLGNSVFYVDDSGNVHAHSFTADLAASTRTPSGATVSTYSTESRSPTIEDFGEATLTAGHAYVRLDPNFAGTLARGVPYFVFITPLGPTRGSLYVSQRTSSGFFVHENGVGGSTIAFDYRIVGKRYVEPSTMAAALPRVPHVQPGIITFPTHPKTSKPVILR